MIFGVPDDYFILLKKLEYLSQYAAEVEPVPLGSKHENESGEVTVSSEDLQKCILENGEVIVHIRNFLTR